MQAITLDKKFKHPTIIFLRVITFYVVLLTVASLLHSDALKKLSYVVVFASFLFLFSVFIFLPRKKNIYLGFDFVLGFYYYGMLGSLTYNVFDLDWSVALKMLMGPAFILFGISFTAYSSGAVWSHKSVKLMFYTLVILPLALYLFQFATGRIGDDTVFGNSLEISIFVNRNNAALYALTLFAFYNVLKGSAVKNFLLYLIVGLSFGTMGVFLAVLVSMTLTVGKDNLAIKIAISSTIFLIAALYISNPGFGIFSRFTPVIDSFYLIATGRIDIGKVSYGELVRILHTSDLSFIFRLKHWLNLFDLYRDGSVYNQILGFGVGSSVKMAEMHLVPHNDYIRYFFECGWVSCFSFIMLILMILFYSKGLWEGVPLYAVSIYFLSENLIDNFVAMAIYYFCAGSISYRIHSKVHVSVL